MKYLLVSYFPILSIVLFINHVSSADSTDDSPVTLIPVYGNSKTKNTQFAVGRDLVLSCNSTGNTNNFTVQWMKNDTLVSEIPDLKNRIKVLNKANVHNLTIHKAEESDSGLYSCVALSTADRRQITNASTEATKKIAVLTQKNIGVVEGDKLSILCKFIGHKQPIISWYVETHTFQGEKLSNDSYTSSRGRVELTRETDKDIPNSVFVIKEATMDDRGNYSCIATSNETGVFLGQSFTMVRIIDKYAALWPFLGICAEVFVLCAIILIYEKKRNKTELEESDTDGSPDQKNTPDHGGKDSNLRHRQ